MSDNKTPAPSSAPGVSLTLSRSWAIGLVSVMAVGWLGLGFGLGLLAEQGTAPSAPVAATATHPPSAKVTTVTATKQTLAANPFTAGVNFPFHTTVDTLTGHPTTLARGSKATVVLAMASWCLFCAYEDKYVMPVLAKTPGVVVDVVDVSPQGGIGDPGPKSPPFSGHDGVGGPLTVAGMEATMSQYVKTFGTLSAPNIHVYVAPSSVQNAWNIQAFPTIAFVNAQGQVAVMPDGAQTISQAQSDLQQALGT